MPLRKTNRVFEFCCLQVEKKNPSKKKKSRINSESKKTDLTPAYSLQKHRANYKLDIVIGL